MQVLTSTPTSSKASVCMMATLNLATTTRSLRTASTIGGSDLTTTEWPKWQKRKFSKNQTVATLGWQPTGSFTSLTSLRLRWRISISMPTNPWSIEGTQVFFRTINTKNTSPGPSGCTWSMRTTSLPTKLPTGKPPNRWRGSKNSTKSGAQRFCRSSTSRKPFNSRMPNPNLKHLRMPLQKRITSCLQTTRSICITKMRRTWWRKP